MTATTDLADRYLAAWNETDPAARRTAIDDLFTDDVRYTDPLVDAEGRDALDATIGAVQEQFPGFVFRLAGPVDAHHDQLRFTWELGPAGQDGADRRLRRRRRRRRRPDPDGPRLPRPGAVCRVIGDQSGEACALPSTVGRAQASAWDQGSPGTSPNRYLRVVGSSLLHTIGGRDVLDRRRCGRRRRSPVPSPSP